MKKQLLIILIGLMTLAAFTSCSTEDVPTVEPEQEVITCDCLNEITSIELYPEQMGTMELGSKTYYLWGEMKSLLFCNKPKSYLLYSLDSINQPIMTNTNPKYVEGHCWYEVTTPTTCDCVVTVTGIEWYDEPKAMIINGEDLYEWGRYNYIKYCDSNLSGITNNDDFLTRDNITPPTDINAIGDCLREFEDNNILILY